MRTPKRSRRMAAVKETGKHRNLSSHLESLRAHRESRGSFRDDVSDQGFKFNNARRRSNSSTVSHHMGDLKSKFEVNDPEPVFEESIHGAIEEDDHADDLSKTDSSESGRSSSV